MNSYSERWTNVRRDHHLSIEACGSLWAVKHGEGYLIERKPHDRQVRTVAPMTGREGDAYRLEAVTLAELSSIPSLLGDYPRRRDPHLVGPYLAR